MEKRKDKLVSNDMSLVKIIDASMSKGRVAGAVTRPFWQVNRETVEEYISFTEAYKRLLKFIGTLQLSALSEDYKRSVAAFLITMENQENDSVRQNEIMMEAIDKRLAAIVLDSTK